MSDSDLCPHDHGYRAALGELPNWRMRIQRCGAHLNEPKFNDKDMSHPSWGIYVCDRPGMYLQRNGERHEVRSDAITLIPPWVSFHYHFPKQQTSGHAYIHVEIPRIPAGLIRAQFHDLYSINDSQSVALMWRWARRFSLENIDPMLLSLEAQNVFSQIFTEFVFQLKPEQQHFLSNPSLFWQRLQPAIDYIELHVSDAIGVNDLATLLACSREHCIRLFRKILKQTPTQYILARRVERAADLLTGSTESIDQIALACGFPNRRYLSRVFKAHMSTTPVIYRNRHN